jgi:hypothetical protein
VVFGKISDTSSKKSKEGPFLKLTESAVAKRKFFEKQGLKFKRPLSAGTFCIFKPYEISILDFFFICLSLKMCIFIES